MAIYEFDAVKVRDCMVKNLQAYASAAGFTDVVLGISGGKDSTVAAALCARALGPEHVYGILMPDRIQADLADSIEVCRALGIRHRIINIGIIHQALLSAVLGNDAPDPSEALCPAAAEGVPDWFSGSEFAVSYSRQSDINVGPRLRMTVMRYVAQAIGARLVGTGNLSETTVGYCTKDGDTSCDFALLRALTSVEVVEVGKTMEEIPESLVVKTPADGLSGRSDEENLGVTYRQIHDFIRLGTSGSPDADASIRRMEVRNRHKREFPVVIGID